MAERHSSENGRHGGPGLPMFCGVIGSVGLAMAAMSILMAGQLSIGQLPVGAVGTSNGVKPAVGYAMAADGTVR